MKQQLSHKKKNVANQPLVSVVMPVFNAEAYVAEAIQSILNQTYKNVELIIVDDASTDGSWKIIKSFAQKYAAKITAVRLKKNLNKGGDSCANIGIFKSRGEFVARMDADDIAHQTRIAKQVAFLQKNPQLLLTGSQAYVIDKNGKITGEKHVPTLHNEIYKSYFVFHPLIHPTVMLRRSNMPKRSNFYQIKYSANNDLLTFFELLKDNTFANMPDKLLYYRVHGTNDSLTKPKERFFNTLKIRLFAVAHFSYRPHIKSVLVTALQTAVISVLPERLIIPVYLYMKGIKKLSFTLSLPNISLPLTRVKYKLYSLL